MKNVFYIFLSLIVLLMINSCGNNESTETTNNERIISIKAMVVNTSDMKLTRTFTGTLEGEKQAVIYAKIAEAVELVNVTEGDAVEVGQVLLNLDKNGPSSNFIQAQSLMLNSEKNFKKMDYLYKEGAVSESQFDAAKTEYQVNQAGYDAASKLVNIETPISGIVTSLNVSVGDFVRVGQRLATVALTSNLRLKFEVKSSEIGYFSTGMEVSILAEETNTETVGKVISVASSSDPVTRAFEVEAKLENVNDKFRPGMFVRVSYTQKSLKDVIVIPRKSILTLDDKETVFVISNGISHKRQVEFDDESNGMVMISSGLKIGDTLVILGQDYLGDSTKVNITELIEGAR